ncbi:hypothetical protein [Ferruginibacter sp.]
MKSFLLSGFVSALICIFIFSVFEKKFRSFINNVPDKFLIVVIAVLFAAYLLSLFWGIMGIMKEQRLLNFLGIGMSLAGISVFVMGYMVNAGKGKASPGQFDYSINTIEVQQQTALRELLQQTNTKPQNVKFVNYWEMNKNPDSFVVCVQKGNIIALQVKNKRLADVRTISEFSHLNWLILDNCNLTSIAELKLPLLERLAVNNNQLSNLAGLENEPNITWLNFQNNPVTDSSALKNLTKKDLFILN